MHWGLLQVWKAKSLGQRLQDFQLLPRPFPQYKSTALAPASTTTNASGTGLKGIGHS